MRRTASPVILDMKGSLPTTRMVVLPETEPATRPPKASSIDLPSTVDEIRTLREELRLEKRDSENLRNFLGMWRANFFTIKRRGEAHSAYLMSRLQEMSAEAQRTIQRHEHTIQCQEHTIETLVARSANGTSATAATHDIQKKDEELRAKDQEIACLTLENDQKIARLKLEKDEKLREKDEQLREKDEVITNLTHALRAAVSRA